MGYVVTFEQTDPLYTVDLSDPENPVTTGELKIPGYSAYLHPVADGRLLGIGQAGTESGTITGAQASLFDVADPEQPERLDALDLSDGRWSSTATEWDHHAFLYSPEHSMAVVPVQSYGRGGLRGAIVDVGRPGERAHRDRTARGRGPDRAHAHRGREPRHRLDQGRRGSPDRRAGVSIFTPWVCG